MTSAHLGRYSSGQLFLESVAALRPPAYVLSTSRSNPPDSAQSPNPRGRDSYVAPSDRETGWEVCAGLDESYRMAAEAAEHTDISRPEFIESFNDGAYIACHSGSAIVSRSQYNSLKARPEKASGLPFLGASAQLPANRSPLDNSSESLARRHPSRQSIQRDRATRFVRWFASSAILNLLERGR
jgi:hypothetical protein